MDVGLAAALALALAFAATNGVHDASNAIATLVATRTATPFQAIVLATFFNLLGPLLIGAAVADTIAGIVTVPADEAVAVIGAGLAAAVAWNLLTWQRGLPSSSSHALVGGLVGAALAEGGLNAVQWGGLDGLHPVGVFGSLIALAISPVLGFAVALLLIRALRAFARRATRRWVKVASNGQWFTSAALAFSHGANDAQKSVGVIAALLLAAGRTDSLDAPSWVVPACAVALTAGTALGGWRIIRTVGRGIYRIGAIDGMVEPDGVCGSDLRRFARGRTGFHEPGRRLVGRRRRRRQAALAPRQLVDRQGDGTGLGHHPARRWADGRGNLRTGRMAHLNPRRWFLPETPDVIGILRAQFALTIEAAERLADWAGGAEVELAELREIEERGERARRDLLHALRESFITPIEPEDLYSMSRGTGRMLDDMADLVGEAEVLRCSPDRGLADMTGLLAEALREIDRGVANLGSSGTDATACADRAIEGVRAMQDHYYRGMATTLDLDDRGERIARRELYRRCSRIGDTAVDVAERIVYSVVKES